MNNFKKILFCLLFVIDCSSSTLGQTQKTKASNSDFLEGRDLTKYAQENFWCGSFTKPNECNKEKMRESIWQCWSEETLCYLTFTSKGTDSSYTEHIFIEPNKKNQWMVVRRAKNGHAMPQHRKLLHDLPKVYFLEWQTIKGEKILIFKNKQKKVMENFLY